MVRVEWTASGEESGAEEFWLLCGTSGWIGKVIVGMHLRYIS
jgi:hypothetical protein